MSLVLFIYNMYNFFKKRPKCILQCQQHIWFTFKFWFVSNFSNLWQFDVFEWSFDSYTKTDNSGYTNGEKQLFIKLGCSLYSIAYRTFNQQKYKNKCTVPPIRRD